MICTASLLGGATCGASGFPHAAMALVRLASAGRVLAQFIGTFASLMFASVVPGQLVLSQFDT